MTTSAEQDRIFATGEGDAWFRRNAAALMREGRYDPLLAALRQLPADRLAGIGSVCDVGCSNGERLARIAPELAPDATLAGFDASGEAVARGKADFPGLDLRQGLAGEPPLAGPFDLVTVGFVLHWIDRRLLARSIAALDGLVAEGGLLAIADFLPDRPCRRAYHHRTDVSLYTFKQDYPRAFTGLGIYREVLRFTFDHSGSGAAASHDQERAVCAILQKSLDYPEAAA
ncbi:MAG: class I SAM-dependent methyltransferase [Tsuneonella sp.]